MNEPNQNQKKETLRLMLEIAFYVITIVTTIGGFWYARAHTKPPPQKVIVEIEQVQNPIGPMGWSPESTEAMQPWADQQAQFRIISKAGETVPQDNSRANVRLWKLTQLNVAQPPPNGPQLTGDCAAWSSCHAIEDTQSAQKPFGGGDWKRIFQPFSYGSGRVWVWRKSVVGALPSEGCSVGAIARAAIEFGVISYDEAREAGYEYSARLADEWGRTGPPEKLKAIAAKHKLGSAALMRNANDVRDAICNGYGVATGGDFTPGNFHPENGRIVADNFAPRLGWNQQWHHAICIDGYDGSTGTPYFHIQNSWYPTSHPAPIDDSPPCGFWVTAATVDYMCGQSESKRDTWAFSDFEGFVERPQPTDLFSTEGKSPAKTRMSP